MKINIIRGAYGYRKDSQSSVTLIDKHSGAIDVSDKEAARLIKLKVAKKAEEETASDVKIENPDAGQFADCSYKDLQKLAKDMGLNASGSKEELIERITAAGTEKSATDAVDTEDANDEEPPVLVPADPE